MTQRQLDRAVAKATFDNLRVISRLGFSLADAVFVEHDPEPYGCDVDSDIHIEDKAIDWDEHDLHRNVPVIAQRLAEPVPA